jgi:ribosomal protein S18 acetylase RimI-like enzyme
VAAAHRLLASCPLVGIGTSSDPGPVVTIEAIGPDGWSRWRSLRLAALADAPEAFSARLADWQGVRDTEARWRARLALLRSVNLLATTPGADVGMASCAAVEGARSVELASMWVEPSARGRGVADALVEAAVKWAEDQRADRVTLGVMQSNSRAIRLYLRHGFTRTDQPVTRHSGGRVEQYMVRTLG